MKTLTECHANTEGKESEARVESQTRTQQYELRSRLTCHRVMSAHNVSLVDTAWKVVVAVRRGRASKATSYSRGCPKEHVRSTRARCSVLEHLAPYVQRKPWAGVEGRKACLDAYACAQGRASAASPRSRFQRPSPELGASQLPSSGNIRIRIYSASRHLQTPPEGRTLAQAQPQLCTHVVLMQHTHVPNACHVCNRDVTVLVAMAILFTQDSVNSTHDSTRIMHPHRGASLLAACPLLSMASATVATCFISATSCTLRMSQCGMHATEAAAVPQPRALGGTPPRSCPMNDLRETPKSIGYPIPPLDLSLIHI